MRTRVRILRGKHAGRIGSIAGDLRAQNKYTTKTVVRFTDDEWSTFDLAWLEPVGFGSIRDQGELSL